MSQADEIREFANQEFIRPAREALSKAVTIRAGDVHDMMGLTDKMPAVCSAIGSNIFEKKYRVHRIDRRGPTSGANVFFTFGID